MAKLSARGSTILWRAHKELSIADDLRAVGLDRAVKHYAFRSDGAILIRITRWWRATDMLRARTDSGSWSVDRKRSPSDSDAIRNVLIGNGYTID